jgi:hypothetical protein
MVGNLAAVLLVLSSNPVEDVLRDRVDLIEFNHRYDENGLLIYEQYIFYDWSDDHSCFRLRDHRTLLLPARAPERDWSVGGYSLLWVDSGDIRLVQAKHFRETWTQYDPEITEGPEWVPRLERQRLQISRQKKQNENSNNIRYTRSLDRHP